MRQTREVRSDRSWVWPQNEDLKGEKESLIIAAQNQSMRTNLAKEKFNKSQKDKLCRLCKKAGENIDHSGKWLLVFCSELAQKENLGKTTHWKLARKCNFEVGDKWYEHEIESVLENKDYEILWDFSIQTDHVI